MTGSNGSVTTAKDLIGALNLPPAFEKFVKTHLERLLGSNEQVVGVYGFKYRPESASPLRRSPLECEILVVTQQHMVKVHLKGESSKFVKVPTAAIKAVYVITDHYIGPAQHYDGDQLAWEVAKATIMLHDSFSDVELYETCITIPDKKDERDKETQQRLVKEFVAALGQIGLPITDSS